MYVFTREKISWLLVVSLNGEAGVDMGGPRREFLSIVLQAVQELVFSAMQTGQVDEEAINKFRVAGLYCGKQATVTEALNCKFLSFDFMKTTLP